MKLAEMPAAQALWDMIHAQIGSFKVQGKIGVEVFLFKALLLRPDAPFKALLLRLDAPG